MKIAAQRERNLRYLAAFLAALPDDYDSFHMNYFCNNIAENDSAYLRPQGVKAEISKCGTVACAVGHLPLLGYRAGAGEDFLEMSLRLLGMDYGDYEVDVWEWLFGARWHHFDNTPKGAAQRIIFALTAPWQDVVSAATLYDEYSIGIEDEDTETVQHHAEELTAFYRDVEVPDLTTLDPKYLPTAARGFIDKHKAGEPILWFLAEHA